MTLSVVSQNISLGGGLYIRKRLSMSTQFEEHDSRFNTIQPEVLLSQV